MRQAEDKLHRRIQIVKATGGEEQINPVIDQRHQIAKAPGFAQRQHLFRLQLRHRTQRHQQPFAILGQQGVVDQQRHRLAERFQRQIASFLQRLHRFQQRIKIGGHVAIVGLPLNAFQQGQEARHRRIKRHDGVDAAGQQQAFIAVAQGGFHLAHHDFQPAAARASQAVDAACQLRDMVAAFQGENHRGGIGLQRPLIQLFIGGEQRPLAGQRRRAFQHRLFREKQRLIVQGQRRILFCQVQQGEALIRGAEAHRAVGQHTAAICPPVNSVIPAVLLPVEMRKTFKMAVTGLQMIAQGINSGTCGNDQQRDLFSAQPLL